jgi:hypothetical protein
VAGYKYPDLVPDMELASVLDAAAITPNDNADMAYAIRSMWVGGAGNVTVMLAKASAPVTYYNVPAGTRLMVSATRVYATGTTATNILAEY